MTNDTINKKKTPEEKLQEKINKLNEKLKQAKNAKQLLENRKKQQETKLTRQQETRKKILLGAILLNKLEKGEYPQDKFHNLINTGLTRDIDRALFNLPPLTENTEPLEPKASIKKDKEI